MRCKVNACFKGSVKNMHSVFLLVLVCLNVGNSVKCGVRSNQRGLIDMLLEDDFLQRIQQFYKQFAKQCSFVQFKLNYILWDKRLVKIGLILLQAFVYKHVIVRWRKKSLSQRIWFGTLNLGKYPSFQKNKISYSLSVHSK